MQLQVLSFDVIDVCSYMSITLMSECKCRKTGNVPQQDTHHLTEIIIWMPYLGFKKEEENQQGYYRLINYNGLCKGRELIKHHTD